MKIEFENMYELRAMHHVVSASRERLATIDDIFVRTFVQDLYDEISEMARTHNVFSVPAISIQARMG